MTDRGPDFYAVLGVPETATDEEIAKAYRRLARQLHPDTNPEVDATGFRDATAAYDVIGDPVRRDAYDAGRRGRGQRGTAIPVRHAPSSSRPSSGKAGSPGREPPAARASAHELVLQFEEAVLGTTAKVQVDEQRGCAECGASGRDPTTSPTCPTCDGSGVRIRRAGEITIRQQCSRCEGQGRLPPAPCDGCAGTGSVSASRHVTVRIPPGVEHGSRVRIPLPGHVGAIHATVRVRPHPQFTRRGRDVAISVPITVAEAALGADLTVPTVDGREHRLAVPAGTSHGATVRIAGGGVRDPAGPGDLVVTVEVIVPTSLSDAQRAALEAFAAATPSPRTHLWRKDVGETEDPAERR